MENWRNRIKAAIDIKGLTQEEWADQAGIAQPTVSAKLNGRRGASIEDVNYYAQTLSLWPTWVTHGDDALVSSFFLLNKINQGRIIERIQSLIEEQNKSNEKNDDSEAILHQIEMNKEKATKSENKKTLSGMRKRAAEITEKGKTIGKSRNKRSGI